MCNEISRHNLLTIPIATLLYTMSHSPCNLAWILVFIVDDDDYDEDALPSFGGELNANSPVDKGKGRAQLQSPGFGSSGSGVGNANAQGLSGNIGSGGGMGGMGGQQGARRTVGGVRVETR